jgi:tripartite-type tricarboxylate transporter receptor subunit TctC
LRHPPKKLNYASASVGSVAHLTWEVIRDGAGIETVHIPYKGGGQAIGDVVAGHVDMNMAAVSVAKPFVESGQLKALVVTGNERSPALPNVPTLEQSGIRTENVELRFWYGLFAPKGIPEPVRMKLERAADTVMKRASVRERLAKLDITADFGPATMLRSRLENELRAQTSPEKHTEETDCVAGVRGLELANVVLRNAI